jgi:hypothetical protein
MLGAKLSVFATGFAMEPFGNIFAVVLPSLGLSRAIPAARRTREKRNAEVISERFLWPTE